MKFNEDDEGLRRRQQLIDAVSVWFEGLEREAREVAERYPTAAPKVNALLVEFVKDATRVYTKHKG